MLDEEQSEDGQMRNHFKERWNRTPSSKLTQQLREEAEKYRTILSNATSADGIVKEKYNAHRRGMEILSKSDVRFVCFIVAVSHNYVKDINFIKSMTFQGKFNISINVFS